MDFTKFNSGNPFSSLNLKLEEIENTMTCEQLYETGKTARVVAVMFSTKGQYGKSPFLVCADDNDALFTMWLPKHMLETCELIAQDKESIDGILSGRCGVRGVAYVDGKGAERYKVEWENI